MKDFEDFGKWLDEEIEHVKRVVKTEIQPKAEKNIVSALRTASEKLSKLAQELDERPGPRKP